MRSTAISRWQLLNARCIGGHPGRSALSVCVVALSAALIVAVLGTYGSLGASVAHFESQLAGRASLEVSGITDAGFGGGLAGRVAALPGVAAAAPMVISPVMVHGQQTLLLGMDKSVATVSDDARDELRTLQPAQLAAADGVVIGPALSASIGAAPGATLRVSAVSGTVHTVHVLGVADQPGARALNRGNFVVAALPFAQRLTGRQGRLDSVFVVAGQGVNIASLRQRLSAAIGGAAVVAAPGTQLDQADTATGLLRDTTLLVALMALVVAAFVVFTSMNMAAAERRAQIATLRVLGGHGRQLMRDFLAEAALLGLAGAAAGTPAGLLLGWLTISRLPPFLTSSFEVQVGFAPPGYVIPVAVLGCLAACLLAAALPALSVLRVEPVEAMRPPELTGGQRGALRWPAAAAGGTALAASVLVTARGSGTYALVAGPLALLGMILVAVAFTPAVLAAAAGIARCMGVAGRIAATAIERSPRRVWATTMTVAIGVATSITVIGVTQNAAGAAVTGVESLRLSDYFVQTTPADVPPTSPMLPSSLVGKIAALPGVARTSPGQIVYAAAGGARLEVEGYARGSVAPVFIAAPPAVRKALLSGQDAVVSQLFARQHRLAVGSVLTLPTPAGPRQLRVGDVVSYVSVEGGMIGISLGQLERWFGRPGATYVQVDLRPGADASAFRAALGRLTAPLPYRVFLVSGAQEVSAARADVLQASELSLALVWIVAGTTGLALFSTLMLSVVERRREIAIIRALGASRRLTALSVAAEATAVGVAGGAIGLAGGVALHYLGTVLISATGFVQVPYHFQPLALAAAVAALALSLIGSLPPARRGARLNIVEAIGYE